MSITIDGLTLDKNYNPYVNFTYEYFTTQTGEIIGGVRIFTISGTVSKSSSSNSGSQVMRTLKTIRNLGTKTKCVPVTIDSFFSGSAKISNVTIDQGSDPTWVNQAPFTIEIRVPLDDIPSNSLGIKGSDRVTSISREESLEIGEESHGFIFTSPDNLKLSKTFVKWSSNISVTCEHLCSSKSPQDLVIDTLKRLALTAPNSEILEDYKNWRPHLHSRTLDFSGSNQASFSAEIILLPPEPDSQLSAFIDLQFEQERSFQDNTENKRTKGTITGLIPITWGDLVDLTNTSTHSKLASAEAALDKIINEYNKLKRWAGGVLELNKTDECPEEGGCEGLTQDADSLAVKPKSSTISKSRSEGTINFVFEWGNSVGNGCPDEDGLIKEVTVDITEPARQIVEHVLPSVGTLIQDLNCCSAKRISFVSTVSSSENDGLCSSFDPKDAESELQRAIDEYIKDPLNWLLIAHTKQTTNNSVSITKEFIEACNYV